MEAEDNAADNAADSQSGGSNVRSLVREVAWKHYVQSHNAWVRTLPVATADTPTAALVIGLGFGSRREYRGLKVEGDDVTVYADADQSLTSPPHDVKESTAYCEEYGSFYLLGDDGETYRLPDGAEMDWQAWPVQ